MTSAYSMKLRKAWSNSEVPELHLITSFMLKGISHQVLNSGTLDESHCAIQCHGAPFHKCHGSTTYAVWLNLSLSPLADPCSLSWLLPVSLYLSIFPSFSISPSASPHIQPQSGQNMAKQNVPVPELDANDLIWAKVEGIPLTNFVINPHTVGHAQLDLHSNGWVS